MNYSQTAIALYIVKNGTFAFKIETFPFPAFSQQPNIASTKNLSHTLTRHISKWVFFPVKRMKTFTQNSNLPFHFLFLAFSTKPKGAIRNEE